MAECNLSDHERYSPDTFMLSDAELSAAEVGDENEHETTLDKPKRRNRYRDDIPTQVAERSDKENGNSPSTASTISSITNSWQGSLESSLVHTQRARPPPTNTRAELATPEIKPATPVLQTPPANTSSERVTPVKKADDQKRKKEITIVFAGKRGAGKSTLATELFGNNSDEEAEAELSASAITKDHVKLPPKTKDGVTINIIDTAGYIKEQKKRQLKELSKLSNGEADLLLYCLPISPSSKFDDSNPDIMASLQDAFGKDIWNHCVVVLTFSNSTWELSRKKSADQEKAEAKYKKLTQEYITRFKQELKRLKVENVEMISVFDEDFHKKKGIVFIPAGLDSQDPVLPGVKYPKADKPLDSSSRSNSTSGDSSDDTQGARHVSRPVNIPGIYPPEIEPYPQGRDREDENTLPVVEDWQTVLQAEIINRSASVEIQVILLTFWYGRKRIERALKKHDIPLISRSMGGGIAGGVAGSAVGGGVGLVIGVAGGPVGMGIGLTLGIVGGAIAGTLAVGGTAAASHGVGAMGRHEEEAEKEETKEDVPQE